MSNTRYRVVGFGGSGCTCEMCGVNQQRIIVTSDELDVIEICNDCAKREVDKGGPPTQIGSYGPRVPFGWDKIETSCPN